MTTKSIAEDKRQAEAVDSKKRNCYRFLWHEDKQLLHLNSYKVQNLPYGFCGICDICGKPGHTRHGLSGPYTGA